MSLHSKRISSLLLEAANEVSDSDSDSSSDSDASLSSEEEEERLYVIKSKKLSAASSHMQAMIAAYKEDESAVRFEEGSKIQIQHVQPKSSSSRRRTSSLDDNDSYSDEKEVGERRSFSGKQKQAEKKASKETSSVSRDEERRSSRSTKTSSPILSQSRSDESFFDSSDEDKVEHPIRRGEEKKEERPGRSPRKQSSKSIVSDKEPVHSHSPVKRVESAHSMQYELDAFEVEDVKKSISPFARPAEFYVERVKHFGGFPTYRLFAENEDKTSCDGEFLLSAKVCSFSLSGAFSIGC